MIDFEAARRKMVDNQLRTGGITDRRLLGVLGRVPRERFLSPERAGLAYIDDVQPLPGAGRRHLAPVAPFAKLIQLATIASTDRVLDLGCATGYSAAVLAELAAGVVAVESDADLAAAARRNLAGLSNVRVIEGPLVTAARREGPFDVIVLEGSVDSVPEALFAELAEGGRLVALVREGATASGNLFIRSGRDVAGRTDFNAALPALPGFQRQAGFEF